MYSKIYNSISPVKICPNNYVSDETLCHLCNIRERRLAQIDNIPRPDLSSADNRDNFMKGDNPINGLLNTVRT